MPPDDPLDVDWGKVSRRSFPALKPTRRPISLRLPESMIGQLRVLANKRETFR
jgi:hypothetical protein